MSATKDLPVVKSSAAWIEYFLANLQGLREIPWAQGVGTTSGELAEIADSLRAWQLGETSDGSHLRAVARKHAEEIGDADFVEAMELFIAEEQRHGETLGRFLDLAGVARAQSDWGDTLFRAFRHCLANMETFTTPVVMAETHALLYYNAIRQATGCPVLRKICEQLLSDEVPHVRMQCERLAILHRHRPRWLRGLTMLLHRVFFTGVTLAIWVGHRRALKAGGYGFGRFWKTAWTKMNWAWRMMDPTGYRWEDEALPLAPISKTGSTSASWEPNRNTKTAPRAVPARRAGSGSAS
jgi:hypothetical protein